MQSLLIKDLSLAEELDREAVCAVRGGILVEKSYPVEPGGTPGGPVTNPWGVPTLPGLPATPWRPMPCWPNQPQPPAGVPISLYSPQAQ